MPANFYKALLPADLADIIAYLHTVPPLHRRIWYPWLIKQADAVTVAPGIFGWPMPATPITKHRT